MKQLQLFGRLTMVIAMLLTSLNISAFSVTPVSALSEDLVISQVYGGGGNSGATYTHDYIELFNRGTTSVSLAGKSVQYASSTGTTWQVTALSGSLAPGQYYLIQQAQGAGGTTALPTPDATGSIAMAGANGKVALVSSTTALSGACPTDGVIDFVGYGTANCFEGTAATPALSNTTAAKRNANGCTETDNNIADFTIADPTAAPTPRNTSSPTHSCVVLPSLSIDDVEKDEGDSGETTFSFTVTLSEAAPEGGVTFDIATSDGTATVTDSDYVAKSLTGETIAQGETTYTFDVIVNGDTDVEEDETFNVTISNPVGATISKAVGVGTILNDDVPPYALSIDDVSMPEGDSGTTTFAFTVTLSNPAPAGGVTFDIATADDTATAGEDYVAKSLTGVTIDESQTTYTFEVSVNGDIEVEEDETFFVNLSNASGATIVDGQGVGTILNDDRGISINDVSLTEGNIGTKTASFTVSLTLPAPVGGVSFDIATEDGTATVADNDYVANSVEGVTIDEGASTYTFDVTINGDWDVEDDEIFYVNLSNVSGAIVTKAQGIGTILNDDSSTTPICEIQGDGPSSPLVGQQHTIQGVVVGDFEGGSSPQMRGFYVQQENCDGDPATSDGIFVFNGSNNSVSLGDLVRVTGTVSEFQYQTQLSNVTNISMLGSGYSVTPTDINLPFASESEKEQYEGMLVRFNQTLYVTELYQLGRFGQVTLSSGGKLWQPTGIAEPGAAALAIQAANNLNRIILDDSNMSQNPDPILFARGGDPLSASNTLRGGDSLTNLTGVLVYTWGGNNASPNNYRILPVNAMGGGVPDFVAVNERPETPPAVGGSIQAVSINLLNYFNTFTNCTNGVDGDVVSCRGANNATEFERQSDKTVAAMIAMDADIFGIVEIENDGYGADSAIQDLVNKLNDATAPGTYAFVDVDAETGKVNAMGVDGIKNGLIYKPATVRMVGDTAVLDTEAFVNGGDDAPRNRVSLLQAFEEIETGEILLVNVNHLKSKGSACNDADAGDGQGNCNIVRTNAATELVTWIANEDPTGTGDPDVLILGDLNSYAMEDPITVLKDAGFTDLGNHFGGITNYSYVFDGQWGYLDYAMASESLLAQVTDTAAWQINSDEPTVLDYNTEFKTTDQINYLYAPDQYRMSDHDPVIVGLSLDTVSPKVVSITRASATPTSAASVDFTVTFSEDVVDVDMADFSLTTTGVSGAAITGVSGSGDTYTVSVSTGTGSGTIRLDIPDTASIEDLLGFQLIGLPFTNGEIYTIDKGEVVIVSILRAGPTPTSAVSVDFIVTFVNLRPIMHH